MADAHAWVTLVECHDVAELHALRAALEAHGVPCRIQGEHTHGIMGAIHGSMVNSRVLVPRPALVMARGLAEDIVGPFDERPPAVDDGVDESPFRRAAELAAVDDEGPANPGEHTPTVRPKSYGRVLLVAMLGVGPLFGLTHVYAGSNVRAGLLALVALFSLPAALQGAAWALVVLAAVWVVDLADGAREIAAYNRRLRIEPLRKIP